MTEPAPKSPKSLLIKLGVLAVVALVVGGLALRGLDLKGLAAQAMEMVREAGPLVYFLAMALLPAVGMPFLVFSLSVVTLFGPRFGTPLTLVLALTAMAVNIALTYALARWALRPPLAKLVTRLGYKIPEVEPEDATDLIVILRVTPGIPFCVQHYLLGLANVPFGKYMWVSCLVSLPIGLAFMLFGDALLHGKGRLAMVSLSVILALSAILHLVRRHYAGKDKVT